MPVGVAAQFEGSYQAMIGHPAVGVGDGTGEPLSEAVDLSRLALDDSPRLEGESEAHTRMLAESGVALPPVLVHRPTMRVIDGAHRLQAAKLKGERTIEVVFFDGDAEAAYVRAVQANITHGLPLTLADRRAAASRILRTHPDWSDRAVAAVTGLAATTVRAIRGRATERSAQSHTRVGRDGRARPVDVVEGRRRAAKVIAERPDASLREVARLAGVSVGTVRDVRRRVQNGDDPVPDSRRAARHQTPPSASSGPGKAGNRSKLGTGLTKPPSSILEGLEHDPALRYSERGRAVVRWLAAHSVRPDDWSRVAAALPPHCIYPIAELALGYASTWEEIAKALIAASGQHHRRPEGSGKPC